MQINSIKIYKVLLILYLNIPNSWSKWNVFQWNQLLNSDAKKIEKTQQNIKTTNNGKLSDDETKGNFFLPIRMQ